MLHTEWELWTYDVWGNAEDGWQVNDRFCEDRHLELLIPVATYNRDQPTQFSAAAPSEMQIRALLNVTCELSLDGDDLTILVNRASDDYPLAELLCISHKSLSPIVPPTRKPNPSAGRKNNTPDVQP